MPSVFAVREVGFLPEALQAMENFPVGILRCTARRIAQRLHFRLYSVTFFLS